MCSSAIGYIDYIIIHDSASVKKMYSKIYSCIFFQVHVPQNFKRKNNFSQTKKFHGLWLALFVLQVLVASQVYTCHVLMSHATKNGNIKAPCLYT